MTRREREWRESRIQRAEAVVDSGELLWVEATGSSNVLKFAYHRSSLQLHVVFDPIDEKTGERRGVESHYAYFKVPRRVYEAMIEAGSRGEYVYWELRNGGYDNRFIAERIA